MGVILGFISVLGTIYLFTLLTFRIVCWAFALTFVFNQVIGVFAIVLYILLIAFFIRLLFSSPDNK